MPGSGQVSKETFRYWGITAPFYMGVVLLVYHRRAGWEDEVGVDWLQFALRSEVWFTLSLLLGLTFHPTSVLWPRKHSWASQGVLWVGPLAALIMAFLSTCVAYLRYGVAFDVFGIQVPFRMLICMGLGVFVFNLGLESDRFTARTVALLTWMPIGSVLIGVLTVFAPHILPPEWLEEGTGLFAYGFRFRGLTSNPFMIVNTSCVAFALLLPRMLQMSRGWHPKSLGVVLYAVGLLLVMILSGVRTTIVILTAMGCGIIWFQYRQVGLQIGYRMFILCGLLVFLVFLFLQGGGGAEVFLDRLDSDVDRFFLLQHYLSILSKNPWGLGFGFEAIVASDDIVQGQRLPPHNTFMLAALYAGLPCLLIHLFVIFGVVWVIRRLQRAVRPAIEWNAVQGLALAWCALFASLLSVGLIFIDHHFAILTALLLAREAREQTGVVFSKRTTLRQLS